MKIRSNFSTIILISIGLIVIPAPAFSEPNNISLTVSNGSTNLPNTFVSASISLKYLAAMPGERVAIEMIPKSRPAGADVPVLSIIGKPDVPTQKYESKSGSAGEVTINLSPGISTKISGTYVYTVIASFADYPNLTRANDVSFVLNPADVSPTPDTEVPRVDWQNSDISKTQITYGEEVSAKVRITDNVGTNDVTAYFYANSPVSGPVGSSISKRTCQRFSGDQRDGFWQCTGLILTEKLSKDDRYSIAFDARDGAGNAALGQAIGSVSVVPPKPISPNLIPTTVIIEAPTQVTLNSNGQAFIEVVAFVQPVDLNKLPAGRSSLDVDLIFKGSYGAGCTQQPAQAIGTYKEGYKFFILKYTLSSTGTCTGTFQFYGDSTFEKTNYPTFTFNVNPYVKPGDITIKDVTLNQYDVTPGGFIYVYYWVTKPLNQSTSGLGAGIGDFGADPGPFGDEYSSIGWTQGVVKGDVQNGMYRSTIQIPKTAKPGTYKTWVFWKGVTGPIYGPNLNIESSSTEQNNEIENFSKWVQEAQVFHSNRVIQAVNSKLGDGGYRYIKLRPDPISDYYKYPSIEKFRLYQQELSKWADFEISNIRIENFIKSDLNSTSKSDLQKACEIQSSSTAKSLKENDVQLSNSIRRISNLKSFDQKDRQAEFNSITSDLNLIASDLMTWINKLPVYQSSNSDCLDFSKHLTYAEALYSSLKFYSSELNKLTLESPINATYINFTFSGNNQNLTGENLYLDGIDSTGNGRGSIEINAFFKAYESKLMFGNQALNYQITATTSTPKVCRISNPKFFLGTDNPFTKFSITPLYEGECRLNFIGKVTDRKDLNGATTTWVSNVRASATNSGKDISTELNDDGIEVDPAAVLTVARLNNGKYTIKVDSNLESEAVLIYASKKGSRTIKFSANTGATTQLKITTSRNLKGYTLVIRFNGDVLDKVLVK